MGIALSQMDKERNPERIREGATTPAIL